MLEKPDATRLRSLVMELKALAEEQRLGRMAGWTVGTVGWVSPFETGEFGVKTQGSSFQCVRICFFFKTGGVGWVGGDWGRSFLVLSPVTSDKKGCLM